MGQLYANRARRVCLGALPYLLVACGDNLAASQDASPVQIADARALDARIAPPADANLIDAAIPPDAVPGSSCSAALVLGSGESHLGDTRSQNNGGSVSCAAGSATSPDALYRIDLPDVPTDLVVNLLVDEDQAQPFDAVLAVMSACGVPDSEVACSDFGLSERVEALAQTGTVFVQVDGTAQFGGSPSGPYQIDLRTRAIVPLAQACDPALELTRCEQDLRCVAGVCESDSKALSCAQAPGVAIGLELAGQTHAFMADHFQGSCAFDASAGASEELFALTLAQASDVRITTDLPATSYDTVVYLLSACEGTELACQDDVDASAGNFKSELVANALPPGDYLIVVDGSSPQAPTGSFGLRVDVTPL